MKNIDKARQVLENIARENKKVRDMKEAAKHGPEATLIEECNKHLLLAFYSLDKAISLMPNDEKKLHDS